MEIDENVDACQEQRFGLAFSIQCIIVWPYLIQRDTDLGSCLHIVNSYIGRLAMCVYL
jgi:hypothetical protein